ncbi:hypothetical protein C2S51_036510 [Perilla frutescens var. frutescens]|nr:hypothetical protein C2S51_036510 [Perilla frutescens var. frutescens]
MARINGTINGSFQRVGFTGIFVHSSGFISLEYLGLAIIHSSGFVPLDYLGEIKLTTVPVIHPCFLTLLHSADVSALKEVLEFASFVAALTSSRADIVVVLTSPSHKKPSCDKEVKEGDSGRIVGLEMARSGIGNSGELENKNSIFGELGLGKGINPEWVNSGRSIVTSGSVALGLGELGCVDKRAGESG